METTERRHRRALQAIDQKLDGIIWSGVVLYWLALLGGDDLPVEALLAGPALMVIGVILIELKKRKRRRRRGQVPE